MKLFIISPGLSAGGAEKNLIWLANKLSQNFKVHLIILTNNSVKQELILDEDFTSIKSDLDLELTKIELSRGKIDFAIENFDRIGKDYPNTQTAIESYYLLSEIYLSSPNIDFEKAKFFMNESMKQNSNSPFKVLINKKREDIEKLIQLDLAFEELDGNVKAENLFISGQILAFNLASYQESKLYFNNIVDNHKESDFYLQSLFALYIINKKLGDKKYNEFKDHSMHFNI